MSALDLIARLKSAGIRLSVQDGKIRLKAEKGALTDELKQEITAHKQEIIALLSRDSGDDTPQECVENQRIKEPGPTDPHTKSESQFSHEK